MGCYHSIVIVFILHSIVVIAIVIIVIVVTAIHNSLNDITTLYLSCYC